MVLLTHLKPDVIEAVRSLIVEDTKLEEYIQIFDEEISRGLAAETFHEASVKSIVTYVNKIPTGNEEGIYLVLDFSSPTIGVMLIKLENKECTIKRKMYDIPEKYMKGKSVKVFDFIAKSICNFMSSICLKMLRIPMGVTFGFPIEQSSLQDCKLLRWTKGFECDDLIGKNVFLALKNSIRKFPVSSIPPVPFRENPGANERKLNDQTSVFQSLKRIYVIGILNDAVSAVLACAWRDPTCKMGAVIGFGASCCYAEKVDRVSKYEAENYGIRDIYINLESSDLGSNGCLDFILSEFDRQLDKDSKTPGSQLNDKMTSQMYLGEIARLALIKCINQKSILGGVLSDKINEKDAFKLEHMSKIELDSDKEHTNCREVLADFGYENASEEDCFQVQFICRCVSRRSANLVAAQMATVINRVNAPMLTIAIDGDLINNYPNFKWYLTKKINLLKNEKCEFQLREPGESGLGPAVMAAVFGEDAMKRDEKLRRLPGFPLDKCHFSKKGQCMNPDCNMAHPCDTSNVNPQSKPMVAECKDIKISKCCDSPEPQPPTKPICPKKRADCGGGCKGYDKM